MKEHKKCTTCDRTFSEADKHVRCAHCRTPRGFCPICGKPSSSKLKKCCNACHAKRRETKKGYVQLYKPDHHRAQSNGYVLEHIVIMEAAIGRKLRKGETVHHKNGVRNDNTLTNLELWVKPQPYGVRFSDVGITALRAEEV